MGSLLLVFLEEEGKGVDDLGPRGPVGVQFRAVLKHGVVLAQLRQEVVQGLDCTSSEDFVQDSDLSQELAGDFREATRQLSNVRESNLEVVAKVREAVIFQTRDDGLNNNWVLLSINLVDDLVLTLQMDGSTHENQRCVEGILVAAVLRQGQVHKAGGNDFVLNALFFTHVVDAHVADDAKAELSNLGEFVLKLFASEILTNDLVELLNSISTEKRFNASIAECDVDEGLEKVGQVLSISVLNVLGLRVSNEGKDHEFGDAAFNHALASIFVHR